ncbi:MAG TPA: GWxTD domain-containing protein [Candidatus Aminicenantes bacterium]|nr:GWxTD domain-containing protein [Candidatus Aminicenantes bacterium]
MRRSLLAALALLIAATASPAQKLAERDLPAQYREWLNLVAYHIQPVEKDVFLQLTSDRDRDLFIETFWNQRDPTPGTPENEYQAELVKRFQYCNEFLGRTVSREGWRTDQGRIYMILGSPQGIENFEGTQGIVPCVAWSYYGDARRDLPPQFTLLFYKRGGVGEFKLYDPIADGPTRLLQHQRNIGDPFDYETLYEKIRDQAPSLAEIAITRIPGEYNYDLSPSPRNAMLMATIYEAPKRDVNPSYASHFLNYRGVVSTEYLTNYVESHASTALIHDPVTGLRFLHFSMVPTDVNVDVYVPKDQFYCSFRTDISLRSGEDIVFQYSREFPLYFPQSDWERVRANGLAIEDSFPVIEGRYKLSVLLTNTVGKQFSVLERDIEVPAEPARPSLNGPFLGYKFETYQRDVHIPFKSEDQKLVTDPKMTFARGEALAVLLNVVNPTRELLERGEMRIVIQGLREADPVRRSYTVKLSAFPLRKVLSVPQTIAAPDLDPDYYELRVALVGAGGETLDEKKESFVISPVASIGHPIANAKGFPLANQFLYRYMLAQQAERTGRAETAKSLYDQAFQLNPDYKEGVIMYATFLNKTGAFEEALQIAEKLRGDDQRRFPFSLIRGQALLGLERYEEALAELLQANRIYNSDTAVLNSLGRCYFGLGRKEEALEALRASLKLNPEQKAIRALIEEIEK